MIWRRVCGCAVVLFVVWVLVAMVLFFVGLVQSGLATSAAAKSDLVLPSVSAVSSQDEAVAALSEFGEVESRYFPDGSWRVWMSGSRKVSETKTFMKLFNVKSFLSDRQCLQISFLNVGDSPVVSQVSKLNSGVAETGSDCPELVSKGDSFLFFTSSEDRREDREPRNLNVTSLAMVSPRVDVIARNNFLVSSAFDKDELVYRIADPSKKNISLKDRVPVPAGWSVEVVSDSVIRLLAPPSAVTWSKSWDSTADGIALKYGWLIQSDFVNAQHDACILWDKTATSCK